MRAIILAAGFGRRMQPLTDHVHKALLPVGPTTILSRIVEGLTSIGVTEQFVVTGYREEEVRLYCLEKHPEVRFTFIHNDRFDTTNNIVSLAMALEKMPLDEDVVLVESDLLFDRSVLEALITTAAENIALVDKWRPGMDGTVVSVEGGLISQVFPPHLQSDQFRLDDKYKTLNIYRFHHAFCRDIFQPLLSCYANIIDDNCYYELVLGMLVNMQRQRIRAAIVQGSKWAEVDDPNDLASARFTFEPEARKGLLDRAAGGYWNFDVLDFHFIRNMHFPTDGMLAALRQALPALVRNYGSRQEILDEKLAWFLKVPAARVTMLSGASQIFPMLPALLGVDATEVLCPTPSFGEFARVYPERKTYADNRRIAWSEIDAKAAGDGTRAMAARLVVFVNPNNPTGTTLSTEAIHAFAKRNAHQQILVDESFIDYCDERSVMSRLEDEALENVLVIRSLGKSHGVPGLRLGFAYSTNGALLARLHKLLPIWSLASPAEHLLELLLKSRPELANSLERTKRDREDLALVLGQVPGVAEVTTGGANFVLARLGGGPATATRAADRLIAQHNIYVKDLSGRMTPDAAWLRLAVRLPHEHRRLASALGEVLNQLAEKGGE